MTKTTSTEQATYKPSAISNTISDIARAPSVKKRSYFVNMKKLKSLSSKKK